MKDKEMDPVFASALRQFLFTRALATGHRRRRWSWRLGLGVLAGTTVLAGGAALAAGLLSQPGAPVDTQLGNVVSVARAGTATVELGPAPSGSTDVSLTLTCMSTGTFYFPDGSSMSCSASDLRHTLPAYRQAIEVVPLAPGQHAVTIKTTPDASWALQAAYINRVITPWGTNALGETYGAVNNNGTPDLVAVVIGRGLQGYVRASDLSCASGLDTVRSPAEALAWDKALAGTDISVPVYKSDGITVIGTFVVVHATGPGDRVVPLSSLSLGCQPPPANSEPTTPASNSPSSSTVSPAAVTTVEAPATTSG